MILLNVSHLLGTKGHPNKDQTKKNNKEPERNFVLNNDTKKKEKKRNGIKRETHEKHTLHARSNPEGGSSVRNTHMDIIEQQKQRRQEARTWQESEKGWRTG